MPLRTALTCCLVALMPTAFASPPAEVDFTWAFGEFADDPHVRVAMTVTATIDGHPCTLQLDTGVSSAVAWHVDRENTKRMRVALAGITRQVDVPAAVRKSFDAGGACSGVVGSLGNAFFEHGTLTLDLGAARLRFQPAGALADQPDAQPMTYARGRPEGDHLRVDVRGPDGSPHAGMLDTGATALDLGALDAATWAQLTGNAALAAGPTVNTFHVHSWGRQLACYRARATGAWQLGDGPPQSHQVTYCPDLGFQPPFPLLAIVGLHPFGNATITLDYVSGKWHVEAD